MNTLKGFRIFSTLICMPLLLALTIGNVNASPTLQGETDFAAIDAYVTEQMNDLGIPGMALGIVQDGQIAHVQGFGVADSSGRAVTPQTPFYIGSTTKSFTALAVMQLVEAGKIDLDAPVQTYLPWFELADKEASAKITVRNLLSQTTGISEKDGNRFWASQQGLEEAMRGLTTIQLTQPVGTTWQYSNINYSLAGLIVEKVSEQSYGDYVTQHIFEPLDMYRTYTSREPALMNGLSDGHLNIFGLAFRSEQGMSSPYLPSGGLISSAEDMSHYLIAQLNDGQYGDTSILSPQGIAALHAPESLMRGNDHYAMGWIASAMDGATVFWHNGDTGRFYAYIMLMPEQDAGYVLLANASSFEQPEQIRQMAANVYSMLNGKSPAPSSQPFMYFFLHGLVLLTPLAQILGIVLVLRKRQGIKVWGAILTVVLNIAAVLFPFGLSQQIPFPLPSLVVVYPDIGYGLITVAVLGIGWCVLYTGMYLVGRRSK